MTENNVELARRGWEAVQRGDLDAVAALLAPDVKWHGGDPAVGCQNRAEALEFIRQGIARRGPSELVDVMDAGDKVVVVLRRATGDGETELVANLTTFRDGKVVEMVRYPSADDALAAAQRPGQDSNRM
ncbi:MAG: nuclear transport factor 2 family protein [Thermoleophilaceae bacterium]